MCVAEPPRSSEHDAQTDRGDQSRQKGCLTRPLTMTEADLPIAKAGKHVAVADFLLSDESGVMTAR